MFVSSLYVISFLVNNFAYDYFIFPFASIIVVFICGINVGKSLEKIKNNKSIGFFTKQNKNGLKNE